MSLMSARGSRSESCSSYRLTTCQKTHILIRSVIFSKNHSRQISDAERLAAVEHRDTFRDISTNLKLSQKVTVREKEQSEYNAFKHDTSVSPIKFKKRTFTPIRAQRDVPIHDQSEDNKAYFQEAGREKNLEKPPFKTLYNQDGTLRAYTNIVNVNRSWTDRPQVRVKVKEEKVDDYNRDLSYQVPLYYRPNIQNLFMNKSSHDMKASVNPTLKKEDEAKTHGLQTMGNNILLSEADLKRLQQQHQTQLQTKQQIREEMNVLKTQHHEDMNQLIDTFRSQMKQITGMINQSSIIQHEKDLYLTRKIVQLQKESSILTQEAHGLHNHVRKLENNVIGSIEASVQIGELETVQMI